MVDNEEIEEPSEVDYSLENEEVNEINSPYKESL